MIIYLFGISQYNVSLNPWMCHEKVVGFGMIPKKQRRHDIDTLNSYD